MMLSSCLVIKINNSHLKFLTCLSLKNIVLIKYDIPQNDVNDDQIKSVMDSQLIYICGRRVSSWLGEVISNVFYIQWNKKEIASLPWGSNATCPPGTSPCMYTNARSTFRRHFRLWGLMGLQLHFVFVKPFPVLFIISFFAKIF